MPNDNAEHHSTLYTPYRDEQSKSFAAAGGKKFEKFGLCAIADRQSYVRNEFLLSRNEV